MEKSKIQRWAQIGLVGLAALIISPVIFMVIKGLVGLAVAAAVGATIVTLTPWVSMKLANWRVKAIKDEARTNPIETMTNLLIEKQRAYGLFKTQVETAVTAYKDFETRCREFSRKYPDRAQEFNRQLVDMSSLVEQKKAALIQAKETLREGENKLVEMKAYWEMSQAAQAAHQAAGLDTGDLYEKLKADTAVDGVFESVNRAFAQLEVAAAISDTPAVVNKPTVVIESEPVLQLSEGSGYARPQITTGRQVQYQEVSR